MKILPRYIFQFGPNYRCVTNSKEEFYRQIIAFAIYRFSFSLWINGKWISKEAFEEKIVPVAERLFRRWRTY
jgi:hypothetical protein